jgi:hypothetical protein
LQGSRASNEERSKLSLLSLASIGSEFDERIGKPVSLNTLCPCCIGHLLVNAYLSDVTRIHHGEASVEAAGVIAAGPQALPVLVVAGLPRETVVFLVQYIRSSTKASWTLLLSQMRTGLENGFRQLFRVDTGKMRMACDLSAVKAEKDLSELELQDII